MLTTTLLHEQFEEQGYVVVEDLLDPQRDLNPVLDDYAQALDEWASLLYEQGCLTQTYRALPFNQRFMRLIAESGQSWAQFFDISLPPTGVTEDTPIRLTEAVFNMLSLPNLLDVVEQLIGPDILSNPIQHARIKPPERLISPETRGSLMTKTGWHQDQGVALPEADETNVLTVWFPMTDATIENGCLQVIPGSHRPDDLTLHCPGDFSVGPHIPEQFLGGPPVTLPMSKGSVLFMHRRTKHSSLSNLSDDIRWSFDLRYQPIDQPTGRPALPGFVVRSLSHPEQVLSDHKEWVRRWSEARHNLAEHEAKFFRWSGDSPACA